MDLLAALAILLFFFMGLMDGSVSSFNGLEWLFILMAVAGIMYGSIYFIRKGKKALAFLLLSLLAIPALLMAAFILFLFFGDVHWQ